MSVRVGVKQHDIAMLGCVDVRVVSANLQRVACHAYGKGYPIDVFKPSRPAVSSL